VINDSPVYWFIYLLIRMPNAQLNGYKATELTNEFPNKSSVNRLLKMLWDIGTVNRLTGSGGSRSARSEETVDLVNDLVLSQEDTPQTHRTIREILIIG